MATAHKVMVTVRKKNGQTKVFSYTTTDLNTAQLLAPSGSGSVVYSSEDCWIVDLAHSTQGTCTQDKVYFNNVDTGITLFTPNCLMTVNRQVRSSPIFVPGGTMVKIIQAT
jgi:hypothetical protein